MNYRQTIGYLYRALPMYQRQGAAAYKKDLTNIRALCGYMSNPQDELKCIHIAGTNGKGSVSHLLASVLTAQGYKTGLFVSPHYKDFRERIKIDGKYIEEPDVVQYVAMYRKLFEEIRPSFFEMTVGMAFWYFNKEKVDYAVIETGLGGRLDSTNIIQPILSVITNISFDHMDLLGDSLEKIAAEKAGIIKPHCPVLIGRRQQEIARIFIEKANSCQSEIYFADEISSISFTDDGTGISEATGFFQNQKIACRPELRASYQKENIRTAWAAIQLGVSKKLFSCAPKALTDGLTKTARLSNIIGRWEVLQRVPLIIADSAHNEDGFRYLLGDIKRIQRDKLHIVCGFVKDKPLDNILSMLPSDALYYFCKANIPRGKSAAELKDQAKSHQLKGKEYTSVKRALMAAKRRADKNDLIIVTGSIFVVAEVL